MIGELLDRMIGVISPATAVQRMQMRATMQQIAAFSNSNGGYSAGKHNRLTRNWSRTRVDENAIPRAQLDQIRAKSWDLYRDNPYARKIVRTLETKVIGRGMHPNSLATRADGTAHVEFRKAARKLWWSLATCIDVRGRPGRGGLDLVELQKLVLRSVILSGEALVRRVIVTPQAARKAGSPVRLMLHVIDAERLSRDEKADEFRPGNQFYRGIELDPDGMRVAYHLKTKSLDEFEIHKEEVFRVGEENIQHIYVQEDVDQLRGVSWFASALMQFSDTGDLQYNVLKASAIAACVIAGYRLSSGQRQLGLRGNDSGDLVDDSGNPITRMQPGMFLNLGQDGDIKGFSPNQPTTNIEAFIQHLLRGTGAALPGIKASTITGDYRNSSFSSERSADNDCWPEMESVQDWFGVSFCQPVYEEVIRQGVVSGYFAGIVSAEEFADREREFLDTSWSGPVPRSINPTDDAKSAKLRIANGQSSPQIECAAIGRDPQDIISDSQEWLAMCAAAKLPEWYIASTMGQDKLLTTPPEPEQEAADAEQTSEEA